MTVTPTDPAFPGGGNGNPVALPSQILVDTKSDIGTPSGGDITTVAFTQYFITNGVSLGTDRIILANGVSFIALNSDIGSLTYTGTGDMFTGVGTNNRIERITLNSPTAGSKAINYDGSGTAVLQLIDMTFGSVDTLGTIKDTLGAQINNVAFGSIATNGFLFTGDHGEFLITGVIGNIAAGILFDLGTATFDTFSLTNSFPDVASGATMVSGAIDSANINADGFGTIINANNKGAGTDLSGITSDDIMWQFDDNSGISDTMPSAMISFNTSTTTVLVQDTPKLITGPWTEESKSQYTTTAAGRITYNGVKGITVAISIATSIESASATNKDIIVYLALNGTEITNSGSPNRVSANDPKNTSVMWELDIVKDDFLEVFIENTSDNIDMIVNKASMRVD